MCHLINTTVLYISTCFYITCTVITFHILATHFVYSIVSIVRFSHVSQYMSRLHYAIDIPSQVSFYALLYLAMFQSQRATSFLLQEIVLWFSIACCVRVPKHCQKTLPCYAFILYKSFRIFFAVKYTTILTVHHLFCMTTTLELPYC